VGHTRLARKDFGIFGGATFNSWFDQARAATMADSVDVTLEIEAYRVDAASQRLPPVESAVERIRAEGVDAYVRRIRERRDTTPAERWGAYFLGPDLVVRALLADGRTADAVTLARALSELFPTLASAHLVLGYALAVSGDPRGAEGAYARGRELFRPTPRDPSEKFPQVDDRWYWLDVLARTAIDEGRAAEAVPLARAIAEMYSGTANAFATYGLALAAAGDVRGADAQYARALALDPMAPRALALRRRLR
jgi:tetratricopeptide (TPR) repeat protein